MLGRVLETWRYPVSCVGGEKLDRITVGMEGVDGDRCFALFDAQTGLAAAPEKEARWRPALFLHARYEDESLPVLGFEDGDALRLDDHRLDARLKAHFGFDVVVGAYAGTGATYGRLPLVSRRYQPATMHIVTTRSIESLAALSAVDTVDRRRFRPTVLVSIETGDAFPENGWIGTSLTIGSVQADVTEATRRCGVTLAAQPQLPEEPGILRAILRHNARNLGVYAQTVTPGDIAPGDGAYAGI